MRDHDAGDAVLIEFAHGARRILGDDAVFARRMGGEEFVVAMLGRDVGSSHRVLSRIGANMPPGA